jgi:hypothetical protein
MSDTIEPKRTAHPLDLRAEQLKHKAVWTLPRSSLEHELHQLVHDLHNSIHCWLSPRDAHLDPPKFPCLGFKNEACSWDCYIQLLKFQADGRRLVGGVLCQTPKDEQEDYISHWLPMPPRPGDKESKRNHIE